MNLLEEEKFSDFKVCEGTSGKFVHFMIYRIFNLNDVTKLFVT